MRDPLEARAMALRMTLPLLWRYVAIAGGGAFLLNLALGLLVFRRVEMALPFAFLGLVAGSALAGVEAWFRYQHAYRRLLAARERPPQEYPGEGEG